MKIELFYAPVACSMVPYINLTEAGADFEVTIVNLGKGEHRTPAFMAINPKHSVPTLKIDDEVLTENVAINYWIARTFPQANLLPDGTIAQMKAVSLMAWCASSLHSSLTPNFIPERFCDTPGTEESVRRCAQTRLAESFTIADKLLANRDWFFDHYTVADAYFFWTFLRATRFKLQYLDLNQFKSCQTHMARMKTRPSVEKLLTFEAKTQKKLQSAEAEILRKK